MEYLIKLVSLDEQSGRAFIEVANTYYLIERPCAIPIRVDEIVYGLSIAKHDFIASSKGFNSFEDLNSYLSRRIVESRLESEEPTPTWEECIKSSGDLISIAPEDIVDRYLERIEKELLPNGEWFAASRILESLLENEKVKTSPKRIGKCSKLFFKVCISVILDYIKWQMRQVIESIGKKWK